MSKIQQLISGVSNFITDAVHNPREQLNAGQQRVRYAWELGVHCYRQLSRHRAEGMAAELTYRTIFSLIPVVVLGLVMFRVFGGLEDVQGKVENQLFSFFGVPDIPAEYGVADTGTDTQQAEETSAELVPLANSDSETANGDDHFTQPDLALSGPAISSTAAETTAEAAGTTKANPELKSDIVPDANADDGAGTDLADTAAMDQDTTAADQDESVPADDAKSPVDDAKSQAEARDTIRRTLHDVTAQISSIDFASIGVVGLLLFIYAAIALADSVEHLSNRIFDAPRSRPVHLRVAIHWSIITLGSGLLAMSLYMSSQVVDWFGAIGASSTMTLMLRHVLSVGASWVLLFLLYALMPNTHVSVRAAAIGSLVSALMWEAAKFGFQIYVATAVPYAAVYGSLGLIPLFLFWMYVTWLIVLFGLILTYTLQTLRGRRPHEDADGNTLPSGDPDWMLPIMAEVANSFAVGKTIDHQEIADRLGLSGRIVHTMTTTLISAGCLRQITASEDTARGVTLARPADKIPVREILGLAHQSRPTSNHSGWKLLESLKQAEIEAAGTTTLQELIQLDASH